MSRLGSAVDRLGLAGDELQGLIDKVSQEGISLTLDQELMLAQIRALVEIGDELRRLGRGGGGGDGQS
ncbi:hypothetical protein [Micromonospora wenchangensis]|uniref:hypothetical protein n=1 Tax=Micromonospora wenchangensis TaxID=1185415 RepID=UPI0037F2C11A